MTHAWRMYAVVGLVLSVGLLAVPEGPVRDLLVAVIGLSAVVAIVVGIRVHRLTRTAAWVLVAVGVLLWAVGDLLWVWFDHVLGVSPFPSGADVAYLAAYPVLAVAFHLLARRRAPGGDGGAALDALIVAVGLTLVLWVAFIEPTWTAAEGSLFERLVAVAYPVGDVVLVVQLAHLASARSRRSPTIVLLAAGTIVMLTADLLFQGSAYLTHMTVYFGYLDPLWAGFYVLWGAAVLHPATPATSAAEPPARHPLTVRRLVFLAVSVLLLPGVIIVETVLGQTPHTTAVSVASVALIAFVLARMLGMVRAMKEQAEHLERLAGTDPVTGLANSRVFASRLRGHLREGSETRCTRVTAVVLVTVERVTEVADILGLRTSEELLVAVGRRLEREAGDGAVVARLGGETFAVLLPDVGSGDAAVRRAQELLDAFGRPVRLSELTVTADVVVGVAVAPDDATTADDLLARADGALSAAKESGRRLTRSAADGRAVRRSALMTELAAALEADDVVVHYQPQVELERGVVLGVEALVRWQHPVHGLLPPSAFVPAAERAGLIHALTAHVLDRSLAQAARWRDDGRDLGVSVNLSARNLLDPNFVDHVREALDRHGVPAVSLDLEVTETMAMVDPVRSVDVLGRLAGLGVTLSVDDYGTGYSSLAYLQRLPVHRLKIDRSFVSGVATDPASAVIVRSTVELGRHLGLTTVAEGVEDGDVLRALHGMGCFAAQGFLLGRPVPAGEVLDLVARIEATTPSLLHTVPTPRRAGTAR